MLSEYRQENSSVDGFIGECLEFIPESSLSTSGVYGEYKDYCAKDGRKYKSMLAFSKEMIGYAKRTGRFTFIKRENNHSTGFFKGIAIANKWDNQNFADYEKKTEYTPQPINDDDVL